MNDTPANTRTLTPATITHLRQWQGRSEQLNDELTAAPLRGLSATLDRDDPSPQAGDTLPPLAHWLYFLPQHRHSQLGPDGHPLRGGFLPPVPLPRRMWAGGRLQWHAPLRVGEAVRRQSRIESVTHKAGRSGDLLFVQVRHELRGPAGLALTEEHDIVYRAAPLPGEAASACLPAPDAPQFSRELVPDDVLLFRYSALTFNGHRIHYDRRYVNEVEGYPGLVVHGPLTATLLADLARREYPARRMASFDFKALRPVFDGRPLRLCGRLQGDGQTLALWAQDHDGCLCMQATATLD